MNNQRGEHISVLPREVIHFLKPTSGDTVIDCTLGLGGHAALILEKIGPGGLYIGIDQDEKNLADAKENLRAFPNTYFVRDNFENLAEIVKDIEEHAKRTLTINGILFDLGLSSVHVDTPERGFSFQADGPLDMRFDTRQKLTAADLVNNSPEKNLTLIFKTYGEEPHSKRIAQAIVEHRRRKRIETTAELAELIGKTLRTQHPVPRSRIFQALRIAVNRELEVFEHALLESIHIVAPGGRVVVISFHSLEDRIAKKVFKAYSRREDPPLLSIQTKKPVQPSDEEIAQNPRCRSAKLRAVTRTL